MTRTPPLTGKRLTRFQTLTALLVLAAWAAVPAQAAEEPQDDFFEGLVEQAKELSLQPYEAPGPPLPQAIADLTSDPTRSIKFRAEKSLWSLPGIPFRARFFHRGKWFSQPVHIEEVIDGVSFPIDYDPDAFNLNGEPIDTGSLPKDVGFAGFALYVRSPTMEVFKEKISFLGASYFRAVGTDHHWGSSGRGIAIDTALVGVSEEFPAFERFWVVRPKPNDTSVRVYARLNGPSVVGIYRFDVTPGDLTTVATKVSVFFRHGVQKAGFAPLTSMFLMGEEQRNRSGAWRPEVHDADGLLMVTEDGVHQWRPLDNPPASRVSRFELTNPQGFGLIQRDRDFRNYHDLKHEYHRRPSIWVQADGDWGDGWVELAEFYSEDEDFDNVGAYWVPADESQIKPGGRYDFAYRLWFCDDTPPIPSGGRFVETFRGVPEALYPNRRESGAVRFVLEARGGGLDEPFAGIPEPVIAVDRGRLLSTPKLERNLPLNTWRLTFDAVADGEEPMELRAFLKRGEDVLTETWIYRWDWGKP